MAQAVRIGLVGDHDPGVVAHRAIPVALKMAGEATGIAVDPSWVPTEEIETEARVEGFDALWCVPASPYRSMEGALRGIRFAREKGRAFLGTCGGFQHAILEYARNVLGWAGAEHGETSPKADRLVITPLVCSLVGTVATVRIEPRSRMAEAYGASQVREEFNCRYGINPNLRAELLGRGLRVTAWDEGDEVRAIELEGHPFFVGTLFQPERAALKGRVSPIVAGFVRAAASGGLPFRRN